MIGLAPKNRVGRVTGNSQLFITCFKSFKAQLTWNIFILWLDRSFEAIDNVRNKNFEKCFVLLLFLFKKSLSAYSMHLWMSSLPGTISFFPTSNVSNVVATWLKFYDLQHRVAPVQVTKFQICSYNITTIRNGENTNRAR